MTEKPKGVLFDRPITQHMYFFTYSTTHVLTYFLQVPADVNCHPDTGFAEHFALSDVFHQNNSKDERDKLRKIELVPELSGHINSQHVE